MNTDVAESPARAGGVTGLAIVGFVALVAAGLWLAVYSTRYVPMVINRIGTAAVYIGSVFSPGSGSSLSVVPTPSASTTLPFGGEAATTSTSGVEQPAKPTAPTKPSTPAKPSAGTKTGGTYQVGGTAPTGTLSGLGDLEVKVDTTGYLTEASTDSFVASTTVPYGDRAAVRFTVKNVGTNWSGTWSFSASIPTSPAYTFHSPVQQSLAPGDSIQYTLGFDKAITGANQVITVTIDTGASDSNSNNNSTTAGMTVLGS